MPDGERAVALLAVSMGFMLTARALRQRDKEHQAALRAHVACHWCQVGVRHALFIAVPPGHGSAVPCTPVARGLGTHTFRQGPPPVQY